jgi:hypothetical protein
VNNPPTEYADMSDAYAAASSGDVLELRTNLSNDNVFYDANIALTIQGDSAETLREWTSTSAVTLNMSGTPGQNITIKDLHIKVGGSNANPVVQNYAANTSNRVTVENVIMERDSTGTGRVFSYTPNPSAAPSASQYYWHFKGCEFIGNSSMGANEGVAITSSDKDRTCRLDYCIVRDCSPTSAKGIYNPQNTTNSPIEVYYNVVENCDTGMEAQSNCVVKNSLFGNNGSDFNFINSFDKNDVTYTGLGTDSTTGFPANVFSHTETDTWTDPTNHDFTLKNASSAAVDAGDGVSDISVDKAGNSVATSGTVDAGPFQFQAGGSMQGNTLLMKMVF